MKKKIGKGTALYPYKFEIRKVYKKLNMAIHELAGLIWAYI